MQNSAFGKGKVSCGLWDSCGCRENKKPQIWGPNPQVVLKQTDNYMHTYIYICIYAYIHTHALEHTNIAPKAVNTNLLMRPWSNMALLWKQQQNDGKIETFFSAGIWRKLRGIWVSSTHLQVSPNFIKILNRVNTSDVLWGSAGSFLAGSEQAWFMVATWVTMSVLGRRRWNRWNSMNKSNNLQWRLWP